MHDDGPIWLRRGGQHARDSRNLRENGPRIAPWRKDEQRAGSMRETRENRNMREVAMKKKAQAELDSFLAGFCWAETRLDDGYNALRSVLATAVDQASEGKGRERHASGEPFEQQTICQTTRAHGIGFATGQAEKKARESHRLLRMENGRERAEAELLGAINYLAAAIIVVRELEGK